MSDKDNVTKITGMPTARMKGEFDLQELLESCQWAAKEFRDNPSDAYIIEKIVHYINSNNLFYCKYKKGSKK